MQDSDGGSGETLTLVEQEARCDQWLHSQIEVAADLLADLDHWLNDQHGDVGRRHAMLIRIKKARELFDSPLLV